MNTNYPDIKSIKKPNICKNLCPNLILPALPDPCGTGLPQTASQCRAGDQDSFHMLYVNECIPVGWTLTPCIFLLLMSMILTQ